MILIRRLLAPNLTRWLLGSMVFWSFFGADYDTADGYAIRDFIHVSDLAQGHLCALERCIAKGGNEIYNLGTGKGTSVFELVKTFEEVNKVKLKYKITKRREGDVAACYADVEKSKIELNWVAKNDISKMCQDAWRWQSCNEHGYEF